MGNTETAPDKGDDAKPARRKPEKAVDEAVQFATPASQSLRAKAAELLARADKIEAEKADSVRSEIARDQRIFGGLALKLAASDYDLARALLGAATKTDLAARDIKHLSRPDSALAQLRRLLEQPDDSSEVESALGSEQVAAFISSDTQTNHEISETAWFRVDFSDKEKVPKGVKFDSVSKLRFAPTRVLVIAMLELGFQPIAELAGKPFPSPGK